MPQKYKLAIFRTNFQFTSTKLWAEKKTEIGRQTDALRMK